MRLTWAQTKHCKRVVFTRRHEIIYRRNKGGCCALPVIFFSAVRALCKLLQGRWNNWLAYLFISSDCWQPTSPGDLAYRQQVKQTGNYCVTFNPGCRSIVDPRLRVFLASFLFFFSENLFPFYISLICYFILFMCLCLLECAMSSFSKVICLSILKLEFVYYMENKMWGNETDA